MINIKRNKKLYAQRLRFQQERLELNLSRKVHSDLIKVYNSTASSLVDGGNIYIVDHIVKEQASQLGNILRSEYKRIGEYCQSLVIDRLQELRPKKSTDWYYKDSQYNFWFKFNKWIEAQAVLKVVRINNTTKEILKSIINKGVRNGNSYTEIAKEIRDKSSFTANRSMAIASTEVHSAFNTSIFGSIESNNVTMESKEWINVGDERTRVEPFNHFIANGEKVGMEEKFVRTGEPLMFPGDSNGSAGNIIRCRCNSLYNTSNII